jgi:hypothetical protein
MEIVNFIEGEIRGLIKHSRFLLSAFGSSQLGFLGGHCHEIPGRKLEMAEPSICSAALKAQFENTQRNVLKTLNLPDSILPLRLRRDLRSLKSKTMRPQRSNSQFVGRFSLSASKSEQVPTDNAPSPGVAD